MARTKLGLEPVVGDAIDTFQQETNEVMPYITGLQTETDDPDYAKNIKQELDWISNSTHYLFDAVDAATEANANAQEALDQIVTISDDTSDIHAEIGDLQATVADQQISIDGNTATISDISIELDGFEQTVTTQYSTTEQMEGEITAQATVTLQSANDYTDSSITSLDIDARFDGVATQIKEGDDTTLTQAEGYTDAQITANNGSYVDVQIEGAIESLSNTYVTMTQVDGEIDTKITDNNNNVIYVKYDGEIETIQNDIDGIQNDMTTFGGEIDANTNGVQNYYDVWGTITDVNGMYQGAAFIENVNSPNNAAFVVDANFAVVANGEAKPLLSVDNTTGTITMNATTPDAQAAQNSADAASATATEALSTAQGAVNTYNAQWSVKTDVNGLQGGVGFYNDGTKTYFVINADVFAVLEGTTAVMEVVDGTVKLMAPCEFNQIKGLMNGFIIEGTHTYTTPAYNVPVEVYFDQNYSIWETTPTFQVTINGYDISSWVGLDGTIMGPYPAGTPIVVTCNGLNYPISLHISPSP